MWRCWIVAKISDSFIFLHGSMQSELEVDLKGVASET